MSVPIFINLFEIHRYLFISAYICPFPFSSIGRVAAVFIWAKEMLNREIKRVVDVANPRESNLHAKNQGSYPKIKPKGGAHRSGLRKGWDVGVTEEVSTCDCSGFHGGCGLACFIFSHTHNPQKRYLPHYHFTIISQNRTC
jgi:hypothetical protein